MSIANPSAENIFAKLRVLELSTVLAGPLVGTFFAELGAQVIKIENSLTGGDVTRSWKASNESSAVNSSSYYASANYNKKVIQANLNDASTKAFLIESISNTDIIIVNFKKGDAQKFGLDYSTLRTINPKLIYASISGFGEESERVAYDAILQAETGFMSMNGEPNAPSTKMPVALIDVMAAHHLKEGILVALLKRSLSGRGYKVSVSLYDSAISSLVNQASNYLMNNNVAKKMGSAHPNIAPYGDVFMTKEHKEILFAIGSDKHFAILCNILELDECIKDERFYTNAQRVVHRAELISAMQSKIKHWKRDDLYYECIHNQVPVGIIKDMQEVFMEKEAQHLLLRELVDGVMTIRPKTSVYNIEE